MMAASNGPGGPLRAVFSIAPILRRGNGLADRSAISPDRAAPRARRDELRAARVRPDLPRCAGSERYKDLCRLCYVRGPAGIIGRPRGADRLAAVPLIGPARPLVAPARGALGDA